MPVADESLGNWVEVNGDEDADAFDELDEGYVAADELASCWGCDDTTKIVLKMSAQTPANKAAVVLRVQRMCNLDSADWGCEVWEGVPGVGTEYIHWSHSGDTGGVWAHTAYGAVDMSAVTNWANIYVRFNYQSTPTGGGFLSMISLV